MKQAVVVLTLSLACSSVCILAQTNASGLQSCANIMPLGDSITVGTNGGYRNELYTGLLQANCGVSFVGTQHDANARIDDKDHEGHSSFTIGDIAREVNGWMSATQPNIITLMIGTNDLGWWSAETAEERARRHDALVGQILEQRSGVWLFVGSVPPQTSQNIAPNNWDRAVLAAQYSSYIKANMEARQAAGQRVRFVDVHSAITTAELEADGVHPTVEGYAKIGRRFLEAIHTALNGAPLPSQPSPPSQPSAPPPAQTPPVQNVPPPPAAPTANATAPTEHGGGGGAWSWSVFVLGTFIALRRSLRSNLQKSDKSASR